MAEKKDGHQQKRLREIVGILIKHKIINDISPQKLKALLEDLGPTFVKMGQVMSMQPTLPADYCRELAKLRVDVAPMDFLEVDAIMEGEYGPDWKEIFVEMEPAPLGSASIAQVHAARLRGGMRVAVKVQRPGIYEKMASDIRLLKKAAGIVKYTPIGHAVDLQMVIDEMWVITKQEMDFLVEAGNALEFQRNHAGIVYTRCPDIIEEYSTAKVLVMEYIEGWYIDDLQTLRQHGYDMDEIALKLARDYVKQIVEDGFFHGDPHCGNLIICEGKIVWIDLGMMGRLSERDKALFTSAIRAVAGNDIAGLKDFVLSIGQYGGRISHLELTEDLERMMQRFGAMDFADMDLMELSDCFLSILYAHGIRIPRGVSMLGRSMATMQGTLRAIGANINLAEVLAAYLSEKILTREEIQKELQALLKNLYHAGRKSVDIPAQAAQALRLFAKGHSRVNMELSISDETDRRMGSMLNRLIFAILIAGLVVGSSLICMTDMQPKLLGVPILGCIGFLGAILLGIRLFVSMVKHKKRYK